MNRRSRIAARLYLLNTALLATHEVDSAYWQEWTLLHLPGGIQLFLVLNLAAFIVVLYGYDRVAQWRRGARGFSFMLAGAGLLAFVIHMVLIASGHPAFRNPTSLGVLVATFCVSVTQLVLALRLDTAAESQGRICPPDEADVRP